MLGALRCVDATTLMPIDEPLAVSAPGARLLRNQSGLYVIDGWTRLSTHEGAFDAPPAAPAVGSESLVLDVRDPTGRYLARRVAIALPRDPTPANVEQAGSLFRAVDVPMFPAASAPTSANWVELRATVRETGSGDGLGGALLRVVTAAGVLARGLTDWRGEAFVPVAGVPITTWSTEPGAVVVTRDPRVARVLLRRRHGHAHGGGGRARGHRAGPPAVAGPAGDRERTCRAAAVNRAGRARRRPRAQRGDLQSPCHDLHDQDVAASPSEPRTREPRTATQCLTTADQGD